ncbi:MAG: HAD hydrolase-like protein [Desulfobacteraceae bacterium]|jgi:phosphoglycolate phosphatase-like HAD superfamily hydrolase
MNRNRKTGAVVFDCDGVMFDSRKANINFYNHLLTHFHLPPMEEEEVDFVHMHTADESIRHIFQGTPHMEEALAYRWKMDYTPFIRHMVMDPGLKELLSWLKPHFGLAVATNRSNTIGDVLETYGLRMFFDIVVSSLDVENPKPHPEALLKILDFFGLDAAQAFYVGDTAVDYETSKGAGVFFIAYKNRELKADFHADSLMDIKEVVN